MRGVIPILAVLLAILGTRAAGARDVFALQGLEGRYRDTAAAVTERLPANAVLITVAVGTPRSSRAAASRAVQGVEEPQ